MFIFIFIFWDKRSNFEAWILIFILFYYVELIYVRNGNLK